MAKPGLQGCQNPSPFIPLGWCFALGWFWWTQQFCWNWTPKMGSCGDLPHKTIGGLSHNVVKWSCMLPMFSWVYRPIQTVTCSWKWQISILTQWDDYYTIYKSRMLDLSVFNSDSGAHERQHCMTPTGRVTPGSGQSCVAPPLLETSISSRTNRATWQSSGAVKETVRNQAIFFGHWKKM